MDLDKENDPDTDKEINLNVYFASLTHVISLRPSTG